MLLPDSPPPGLFPSWDDVRLFLAISKAGSFSKAAASMGVTQPTISRRIENLEQHLEVRLFDRVPRGVALTGEGEILLQRARRIEEAFLDLQRHVQGSDARLEGPVRISVTDGLGSRWLTPRLVPFQTRHPGIVVELLCSIEPADVLNMASDLAVQFGSPEQSGLVALKLATAHFIPWASPGYLEAFGAPTATADLPQHHLLDHVAYESEKGDWEPWWRLQRQAGTIRYRTNSSAALAQAIQHGLGIGLLPSYVCDCVTGIVPLDIGLRTTSEIWLSYHPNVRNSARVRAVIDWIRELFDHETWPWFREAFHPPGTPPPLTLPAAGVVPAPRSA